MERGAGICIVGVAHTLTTATSLRGTWATDMEVSGAFGMAAGRSGVAAYAATMVATSIALRSYAHN